MGTHSERFGNVSEKVIFHRFLTLKWAVLLGISRHFSHSGSLAGAPEGAGRVILAQKQFLRVGGWFLDIFGRKNFFRKKFDFLTPNAPKWVPATLARLYLGPDEELEADL